MRAYSMDLRTRVLAALDAGGPDRGGGRPIRGQPGLGPAARPAPPPDG
jgi:hypothetical protein